jgi:hypothetical protein
MRWKRKTDNREQNVEEMTKIAVFKGKQIRKTIYKDEWYFSVVDIIEALTDSDNPRNYWNMMKAREKQQSEVQLSTFCVQLKLTSSDGKSYKTDWKNRDGQLLKLTNSIKLPTESYSPKTVI